MPFRSRIKRIFTFDSSDEDGASRKSPSKSPKKNPRLNDPNVYQPGEKMPPLKYRRPVAPEHKAHLESFEWATAWRRSSFQSQYSPMGSRMPSRRGSVTTQGCESVDCGLSSLCHDEEVCIDSGFGGSFSGEIDPLSPAGEGSDIEFEAINALSRQCTQCTQYNVARRSIDACSTPPSTPPLQNCTSDPITITGIPLHSSTTRKAGPFTSEELEIAMRHSNLEETTMEASYDSGYGTSGGGFDERHMWHYKLPSDVREM